MSIFKRARKILLRYMCGFGYSSDPELNALKQTLAERRQKYAQLIAAQVQVKQEISRAGNDEAALAILKEKLHSLGQEQENAKGPLLEIESQLVRFNSKRK